MTENALDHVAVGRTDRRRDVHPSLTDFGLEFEIASFRSMERAVNDENDLNRPLHSTERGNNRREWRLRPERSACVPQQLKSAEDGVIE